MGVNFVEKVTHPPISPNAKLLTSALNAVSLTSVLRTSQEASAAWRGRLRRVGLEPPGLPLVCWRASSDGVLPWQGEVQALFLRHEGYLGAIGAFLKGAEQDSESSGHGGHGRGSLTFLGRR